MDSSQLNALVENTFIPSNKPAQQKQPKHSHYHHTHHGSGSFTHLPQDNSTSQKHQDQQQQQQQQGLNGQRHNHSHHHPSLVMLDNQTDTTHHLQCGCCGGACISEQAWWKDSKQAEAKCAAARAQGYNSSPNSPLITASTASVGAAGSPSNKRPGLNRLTSTTSVLSLDNHASN